MDVRVGLPREELLRILPEYDALLVRSQVQVDAEAIAAGKRLLVIGRAGVGVDNIDLPAATQAGIVVVNAPTGNTIAATEHTLALLFALARRVAAADASVRRGEWKRAQFTGRELRGKTLGIIGLGKIGMAVADRARGMEMDVMGYDPFVTDDAAALHGVRLGTVAEILEVADAVTVHVPLTRTTRGMIGAAELATMKREALLVNVARGGVIDETALAEALTAGTIAGAAIDVYTQEPPPADSPLLSAPNTLLTPHLGASTEEAQTRVSVEAAEQVLEVLAGRSARSAVNAPMVTPETARALAPYLPLARILGQIYAQFAPDLRDLTLEVRGELAAHDSASLVAATLGGLLERDTEERVNVVNAASHGQGPRHQPERAQDAQRGALLVPADALRLGRGGWHGGLRRAAPGAPRGALAGHGHRPEHAGHASPGPAGHDGPVGSILGEADVNISSMHLARSEPRADAFMVLALDDTVQPAVAERIRAIDAVLDLWLIQLD